MVMLRAGMKGPLQKKAMMDCLMERNFLFDMK